MEHWSNDHNRNDHHDHDHDHDHDADDDDGDGDKDKASANIGLASASERPLQQIPAVANFENTIFWPMSKKNFWSILTSQKLQLLANFETIKCETFVAKFRNSADSQS